MGMETGLLERFLRYIKINTQADERADGYPSSQGQLELGKLLADEMRALGISDVSVSQHGIVMGTIPATDPQTNQTIAWIAHLDTSPETSGKNVQPILHENYRGKNIALPEKPGLPKRVIRVEENPDLKACVGHTIVTSDGSTLLGADDKAGVAVIMSAAEQLLKDPSILHGPIRIVFTCDEEIGKGTAHLESADINAVAAYTVDGEAAGHVDVETFSADLAKVIIHGINIHPSIGKNRLVNAIRIASEFIQMLPKSMAPETTDKRKGFLHPYTLEGGVAKVCFQILLRDFETKNLKKEAALLNRIKSKLSRKYPKAKIEVTITKQYRNMREGLRKEPRAAAFALEAVRRAGLKARKNAVRGGTDGSALSEKGLPTPNLSCGGHVPHSPCEWASLQEMKKSCDTLIELAKLWSIHQ